LHDVVFSCFRTVLLIVVLFNKKTYKVCAEHFAGEPYRCIKISNQLQFSNRFIFNSKMLYALLIGHQTNNGNRKYHSANNSIFYGYTF